MFHSSRMERSRLTIIFTIMVMTFMASFNSIDAVDTSCITNSDCYPNQYCYDLSNTCVDYTRCSRYNRQEGPKHAESPIQCGPCVSGYIEELLATGARAEMCIKKINQDKKLIDENPSWIQVGAYIAAGFAVIIIIIGSLTCFFKNRVTEHGGEKWFKKMAGWSFTPTAPPLDTGSYQLQASYYNDEPPIYSAVINNNINSKDRNNLVSAVPFRPPDWIDLSQNYDVPDNSPSSEVVTSHIDIPDEETNPSTWAPEPVTVQVPARAFHQFAPEQRDNVLNSVIVRSDCSSNESTRDRNSPGPGESGPTGNSRTTGETYRGPSVQINQMITLNMVNTDN